MFLRMQDLPKFRLIFFQISPKFNQLLPTEYLLEDAATSSAPIRHCLPARILVDVSYSGEQCLFLKGFSSFRTRSHDRESCGVKKRFSHLLFRNIRRLASLEGFIRWQRTATKFCRLLTDSALSKMRRNFSVLAIVHTPKFEKNGHD